MERLSSSSATQSFGGEEAWKIGGERIQSLPPDACVNKVSLADRPMSHAFRCEMLPPQD